MATRVGRGKIQLAAFDGPFPKTPLDEMENIDVGWPWRSLTTSMVGYPSDSGASCWMYRCVWPNGALMLPASAFHRAPATVGPTV